jgi:N-acetylglucosamine malate deacetylase 1
MARVLVVGPHPDDQEAGMGATVAKLAAEGHDVLLLDLTNGEPTPLGDPGTRAKEAAAAAELLGVKRITLDLPNRWVEHSIEARRQVAGVMREHQSQIVFTPFFEDAHPDHKAGTRIVEDARFDAKLTKAGLPGERCYPRWLFYYYATHLRWVANPTFCIDVTGYEDMKVRAVKAYHSQFVAPVEQMLSAGGGVPHAGGAVVQDAEVWLRAGMTYFGTRIGTKAAEPFFSKEPVALWSLDSLPL